MTNSSRGRGYWSIQLQSWSMIKEHALRAHGSERAHPQDHEAAERPQHQPACVHALRHARHVLREQVHLRIAKERAFGINVISKKSARPMIF